MVRQGIHPVSLRAYDSLPYEAPEQDLILNTNEKYFQQRCNYLLKDFLIIKITSKAGSRMIRINMEESYKSYQAHG